MTPFLIHISDINACDEGYNPDSKGVEDIFHHGDGCGHDHEVDIFSLFDTTDKDGRNGVGSGVAIYYDTYYHGDGISEEYDSFSDTDPFWEPFAGTQTPYKISPVVITKQ